MYRLLLQLLNNSQLNDGTLEQLANKGNGNYFYLDSIREARKVMETDIAANMEVVTKDVKLQIEFNPSQVREYRLVGYENRALENRDFSNDRIDAGEIGSGHTVTALYEIVLNGSDFTPEEDLRYRYGATPSATPSQTGELSAQAKRELAFLKLRYKEPEADSSKLLEFPILSAAVQKSAQNASQDFKFAAAVSYFAHKLRNSRFSGGLSYGEIAKLAQEGRCEDRFGYRQELIELVKDAEASSNIKK
jgi:Ca-activated chloride channel family protein